MDETSVIDEEIVNDMFFAHQVGDNHDHGDRSVIPGV